MELAYLPVPEAVVADLIVTSLLDWMSRAAFLSTCRGHAALSREAVVAQRDRAAAAVPRAWLERGHRRAARLHGVPLRVAYGPPASAEVAGPRQVRGLAHGIGVAPARGHEFFGRGLGIAHRHGAVASRLGRRVVYWQQEWGGLEAADYLTHNFCDFLPWTRMLVAQRLVGGEWRADPAH